MKTNRKNNEVLLSIIRQIVLVPTLLVGCAYASAERIELTYLHAFAHWNTPLEQQIVDDFNRTHPNIHVTMEPVTWDKALEVTMVRTAAGVSPDIVSTSPTDFFGFAGQQRLFYDLSNWVKINSFKDIPSPVWNTVSINGIIYAIPQRLSTQVLFYNTQFFSNVGLARLPYDWLDATWNWDKLRLYASRLTLDRDGDGKIDIFALQNFVPTRADPFIWQAGAERVSADYKNYTLDSPEGVVAVEYMRNLVTSGYIGGNFLRSSAAMYEAPPTEVSNMQSGFPWDMAPLPQGPAGASTTLGPIAVGITKASRNIEAALVFLQYYRSHEVAVIENQGGIFPQPFTSVTATRENYPPGMAAGQVQVMTQALEVGHPHRDNHPKAAEIKSVIDAALTEAVVRGTKAPRVALEEIRLKILQLLNEN